MSLELAHVRDSGPTDPAQRKQLFDASQLEQKGEAAIKSGDYKSAEDSLLKARGDSAPAFRTRLRRPAHSSRAPVLVSSNQSSEDEWFGSNLG